MLFFGSGYIDFYNLALEKSVIDLADISHELCQGFKFVSDYFEKMNGVTTGSAKMVVIMPCHVSCWTAVITKLSHD